MKKADVLIYYTILGNFSKLLVSENGLAFIGWNMSILHLKTIMK